MSAITFDFCALHYLNQWIKNEERYHANFLSSDIKIRSKALSEAMHFFRVSRNAHREYDVDKGFIRYQPAIEIIDEVSHPDLSRNVVNEIESIAASISKKYGGTGLLSFTTKALWLKLRSPVIIYDSRVRDALKTDEEDLAGYYEAWGAAYARHKDAINAACAKLPKVQSYCANQTVATQPYIKKIANEEWFKHRILDIYFWHGGIA